MMVGYEEEKSNEGRFGLLAMDNCEDGKIGERTNGGLKTSREKCELSIYLFIYFIIAF